jgi:hypothetical protein
MQGQNRSVTIVAAFLIEYFYRKFFTMTLKQAMTLISQSRPQACPFRDNRKTLIKYEVILYGTATMSFDDFAVAKLARKYEWAVANNKLTVDQAGKSSSSNLDNVDPSVQNGVKSDNGSYHISESRVHTDDLSRTINDDDLRNSNCDECLDQSKMITSRSIAKSVLSQTYCIGLDESCHLISSQNECISSPI